MYIPYTHTKTQTNLRIYVNNMRVSMYFYLTVQLFSLTLCERLKPQMPQHAKTKTHVLPRGAHS